MNIKQSTIQEPIPGNRTNNKELAQSKPIPMFLPATILQAKTVIAYYPYQTNNRKQEGKTKSQNQKQRHLVAGSKNPPDWPTPKKGAVPYEFDRFVF